MLSLEEINHRKRCPLMSPDLTTDNKVPGLVGPVSLPWPRVGFDEEA